MMGLMHKSFKVMHVIGYAWVGIVGFYIVLQYIRVLLTVDLPLDQRVFSLLNLWNIVLILMALMPGLVCILIADHFGNKREEMDNDGRFDP